MLNPCIYILHSLLSRHLLTKNTLNFHVINVGILFKILPHINVLDFLCWCIGQYVTKDCGAIHFARVVRNG